jgi:glycosyltransferase involved in cell wall biosynthesis
MRICFYGTAKGWGGGELLLSHLIEGLAARGVDAAVIARTGSPTAAWASRQNLPLLLEVAGRGRLPQSLKTLRSWLQQTRPAALVLNDPHAIISGGIAAWRLGIPRIGIRHTVFSVNGWKHRMLLEHLVCVSQAAQAACLKAGIPATMMSVIHCGLPNKQVPADDVRAIRQLFAMTAENAVLTSPARHLLSVGSLIPIKGFDTSLRAIARGIASGQHWHLWLAGDGTERASLEKLANALNISEHVHFLGFRDDVTALMAAADAFLSSSYSEGLPLVLVEAMQAGCPIASTPVGGCAEALQVDASGQSPFAEPFTQGGPQMDDLTIVICVRRSA